MSNIGLAEHFTYKKLIVFTLPSAAMMIITSIYSIVDGFFISNLVGKNEFAAVNLIMPFLMILAAFGFMIGSGGSALVAKILGEGKGELANKVFSMLIIFEFIIGIIASIIGFIFMPDISYFLGARDNILDYCVIYGRVSMISLAFFMLQASFQSFLVTAEKARFGLVISVCAGVLNGILDFLLIYFFKWGLVGAALATSFSEILGGLIPLIYLIRKNSSRLRLIKPCVDFRMLRQACFNGISEMLTNISMAIIGMLYNFQLLKIAQENGVAAYGVIMYVNFIFMSYFFGYAVGVGPIVGYNYGAQNKKELNNLLKKSIIIIMSVSIAMTLFAEVLAGPLSGIFVGYDAELCEMSRKGMMIYSISFLLCGYNIFASAFFTGLNNGIVSGVISFMRTLVIQAASIMILPILFGINGIWMSIIVAEILTLFISVALFVANRKKYGYY